MKIKETIILYYVYIIYNIYINIFIKQNYGFY